MNIKHIHIQNFKSIRDLKLDVRRVNVFIGEPNTGKTNVIEALSLLSENLFVEDNFRKVIRFQNLGDLFFEGGANKPVQVNADELTFFMDTGIGKENFGKFLGGIGGIPTGSSEKMSASFHFSREGELMGKDNFWLMEPHGIRRYIYEKIERFTPLILSYLNPPFGNNLPQILYTHPHLSTQVSDILRERGFKLLLRPVESEIHLAKEVNDKLVSYPFQTISETWKRIIFMLAVLETNKDQVLLLDEPEANIFPFFNTQIAETIGLYNTNQFFITTHNPYLLQSLIAKTPKKDLCVFVTRMENFETKVQQMDEEQLSEAMDLGSSIFSNLDAIVEA